MKRFALTPILLLLLAPAVLGEEPAPPAPAKTPCFRLEIGIAAPKIIDVRLAETAGPGKGIDAALLDLDGDGAYETTQAFPESEDPRTKKPVREAKIRIHQEDADFTLDLYSLGYSPQALSALGPTTYVHWAVEGKGLYMWFINVQLPLHDSPEAARKAEPFRMGPPFTWKIGTATRGAEALVSVGLHDANGGTLRLARRDGVEVRPEVKLVQAEKEEFSATAVYG